MDVNFGSSPPFSLGIEEEFQLVDADSYELVSRSGEIVAAAPDHWRVKPELLQSVIEAATPVARTVAEAQEGVRASRARLRSLAAEENALILSAGTHPFSRYEHQEITDEKRYTELAKELQWVAERELIFGLHVHVGVESAETAIAVANAMRAWLPELLALSVNSPFWQGRETGLASTRSTVFDAMPRSGLPPAFASWDDFARLVERGVRTNSFADYTYLWWDLRPHAKLGTVEIRICDAQTRLASTLTIAALVQSLVATLAERFGRDGSLPIEDTTLLRENKWRAVRHGLDADLIWLERDEERPARTALRELVELARPAALRLGCLDELSDVEGILTRGSGADEQRLVRDDTGSLLALARWVAEETVRDI